MAKPSFLAWFNKSRRPSPVTTPGFTVAGSLAYVYQEQTRQCERIAGKRDSRTTHTFLYFNVQMERDILYRAKIHTLGRAFVELPQRRRRRRTKSDPVIRRTYLGFGRRGRQSRAAVESDLVGGEGTHGREREYKSGGGSELHDSIIQMARRRRCTEGPRGVSTLDSQRFRIQTTRRIRTCCQFSESSVNVRHWSLPLVFSFKA